MQVLRSHVHLVAIGHATGAHVGSALPSRPVVIRDIGPRSHREALALVGVFVEDRPYLRAGQRTEPRLQKTRALLAVGGNLQLVGNSETDADVFQILRLYSALFESVKERLLHLEDAFRREDDVVQALPPDVVVDLDKLGLAVISGLDVDLPGIVIAGRDLVELCEADLKCHAFSPCL